MEGGEGVKQKNVPLLWARSLAFFYILFVCNLFCNLFWLWLRHET